MIGPGHSRRSSTPRKSGSSSKRAPTTGTGIPKIGRLVIRRVPEESARAAGVQGGEAQITEALPAQVMESLNNHATLKPLWAPMWNVNVLGVNLTRPPFDNVKIRQAINYAIDRDVLTKNVLQAGQPIATYPPRGILGYDASLPANPYDPEKATQLIQEAGVPINQEAKLSFGLGAPRRSTRSPSSSRTSYARSASTSQSTAPTWPRTMPLGMLATTTST